MCKLVIIVYSSSSFRRVSVDATWKCRQFGTPSLLCPCSFIYCNHKINSFTSSASGHSPLRCGESSIKSISSVVTAVRLLIMMFEHQVEEVPFTVYYLDVKYVAENFIAMYQFVSQHIYNSQVTPHTHTWIFKSFLSINNSTLSVQSLLLDSHVSLPLKMQYWGDSIQKKHGM